MNLQSLVTILNDIVSELKSRTPRATYIPVTAFIGAWLLAVGAAFGVAPLLAYWRQLSGDLRILLIAALVFVVLLLAFLVSYLRPTILQVFQGRWVEIIDLPPIRFLARIARQRHLDKWRMLNKEIKDIEDVFPMLYAIEARLRKMKPKAQDVKIKTKRTVPAYVRLNPETDLQLGSKQAEIPKKYLLNCYTLTRLKKGTEIEEFHVRAEPWPGYLRERKLFTVSLPSKEEIVGVPKVEGGDLVDITFTRKYAVSGTNTMTYSNILVLDAEQTKETLTTASGSSTARNLTVLLLAIEAKDYDDVLAMMPRYDLRVTRPTYVLPVGTVPVRLPSANWQFNQTIQGFFSAGDVVDIKVKLNGESHSLMKTKVCSVEKQREPSHITVAVPIAEWNEFKNKYFNSAVREMDVQHTEVMVPKSLIAKGTILIESLLKPVRLSLSQQDDDVIFDKKEILNREAKQDLIAKEPIRRGQIKDVEWKGGKLQGSWILRQCVKLPPPNLSQGDILNGSSQSLQKVPSYVLSVDTSADKMDLLEPKVQNYVNFTSEMIKVPVLTKDIQTGEVIGVSDIAIDLVSMNIGRLAPDTITSRWKLVGRQASKQIKEKTEILESQLSDKPTKPVDLNGAAWLTEDDKNKRSEFFKRLDNLKKSYHKQENTMDKSTSAISGDAWYRPDPNGFFGLAGDTQKLCEELKKYEGENSGNPNVGNPDTVSDLIEKTNDFYNKLPQLYTNWHHALERRVDLIQMQTRLYYPIRKEERFLPTTLGNIMSAAETYPSTTYGIKADIVLPRLKQIAPKEFESLADSGSALDMLLLTSFLSWLFWLPASAFLYVFQASPIAFGVCFFGAPILAWLCYKAAIQSALSYAEHLRALYDLHRWKLLRAFNIQGLDEIMNLDDEVKYWQKVNTLFEDPGDPNGFRAIKYKTSPDA